jgi:hypothetical protein
MKAVFILLAAAVSLQIAAAFAKVAAVLQQGGSAWADTVGFGGIAVATIAFVVSSVFIWRMV